MGFGQFFVMRSFNLMLHLYAPFIVKAPSQNLSVNIKTNFSTLSRSLRISKFIPQDPKNIIYVSPKPGLFWWLVDYYLPTSVLNIP